jgi:hypothetical protein
MFSTQVPVQEQRSAARTFLSQLQTAPNIRAFVDIATEYTRTQNPSIAELAIGNLTFWRSTWFSRLAAPSMPLGTCTSSLRW